jgi:CHRD domain
VRWFAVVALIVGAPVIATTATATRDATAVICHRTASVERPYVRLTIPIRRLGVHREHAADVIPASRSCPGAILTPFHAGTALGAALLGGPGADPVATGSASIRVRRGQGQVCAQVAVEDLSYQPTVGIHLHRVEGDAAGETVAIFRGLGLDRSTSSCARIPRALVSQILRTPGAFEVDVHTPDFNDGAVRGRLGPPVLPPARALGTLMRGAAVCAPLCGTGDPDGVGFAYIRLTPLISAGNVCFRLEVTPTVALPALSAHVHRGAPGHEGPVVVTITPPGERRALGCSVVHHTVYDEILLNPAGFYVDIHNAEFPDGAIRGQLPAR